MALHCSSEEGPNIQGYKRIVDKLGKTRPALHLTYEKHNTASLLYGLPSAGSKIGQRFTEILEKLEFKLAPTTLRRQTTGAESSRYHQAVEMPAIFGNSSGVTSNHTAVLQAGDLPSLTHASTAPDEFPEPVPSSQYPVVGMKQPPQSLLNQGNNHDKPSATVTWTEFLNEDFDLRYPLRLPDEDVF
jgi:hypothetical protein